jgi:hypothetical protein
MAGCEAFGRCHADGPILHHAARAESFTGYYSIPCSGLGRKILEFVWLSIPLLPISWRRLFNHNIRPDFRVFRIQRQPFLKPRFGISLDRVDWALRLANTAIDAFVRVDDQHVLALVEAIHRAHLDAVHRFATNTVIVDDVGQLSLVPADRRDEVIHGVCHRDAHYLTENGRRRRPASSDWIETLSSRHLAANGPVFGRLPQDGLGRCRLRTQNKSLLSVKIRCVARKSMGDSLMPTAFTWRAMRLML